MRSVLAAVAVALFCGCLAEPGTTASSPAPVLVTQPGDFGTDGADLPHLHDYWGGADRLVVMDGWPTEPGPGLAGGDSVPIYQYRAPSGSVVPQGTAFVEVTFTWEPAPTDVYQDPRLWVRSAADTEAQQIGPVHSGQPTRMESANERNDLPHQLLSAWVFEFRLSERSDLALLRFKANVTIHVEAVRGLEIPLYPGHPDRWEGQSEILLVDVVRPLFYLQDPGDGGCDGFSCPTVEVPRNGTIVPPDAAYVLATLTLQGSPTDIGLSYHGAEGRGFQRLSPMANGPTKVYHIPVGSFGDGPYAQASQWEFAPYIEGPVPDGLAYEEFHLVVVVHRFLDAQANAA